MATAKIPPQAQLSEAAEYRNFIVGQAMPRLQHLAWRALNVHHKKNTEYVIVCIQVDSRWCGLVERLMPRHDWNAVRAKGMEPIAQGTASWGVCNLIAKEFPDLATVILENPPPAIMKGIVLSEGGCTVFDIVPKEAA